jgi:hypothetical protein
LGDQVAEVAGDESAAGDRAEAIALTRMPDGASTLASSFITMVMPAFDAL